MYVNAILLKRQGARFDHLLSLNLFIFLKLLVILDGFVRIDVTFAHVLKLRFLLVNFILLRPFNDIFVQNIEDHWLFYSDEFALLPQVFSWVYYHLVLVVDLNEISVYL